MTKWDGHIIDMADTIGVFDVTITVNPEQYRVNLAITLQCQTSKHKAYLR